MAKKKEKPRDFLMLLCLFILSKLGKPTNHNTEELENHLKEERRKIRGWLREDAGCTIDQLTSYLLMREFARCIRHGLYISFDQLYKKFGIVDREYFDGRFKKRYGLRPKEYERLKKLEKLEDDEALLFGEHNRLGEIMRGEVSVL